MQAYPLLISGLPNSDTLQVWQKNGIRCLLNVSGIDIFELYPDYNLAAFTVAQFTFADIFTLAPPVEATALADSDLGSLYVQLTDSHQRQALLAAVQCLQAQLQNRIPTSVFCHRGQGRSPLVAAAAYQHFYQETGQQAIARILAQHRPAVFTHLSLSALHWCASQLPT
ncbi:hypothetical protein KFZ76_09030 [Methylovulum psychrotolerans]|jgi:hypothetical protein|uniref:hypothetical protein n=1 Tax=Methylovulum psychrotolerans TaxID=1704499 RepID=UPI001BFFAF7F|nr:hypothetical protein [Methylovulum psychrotolerans]MBT9097850.1 hypothetical protein [Methylovulum psychrotolerans]